MMENHYAKDRQNGFAGFSSSHCATWAQSSQVAFAERADYEFYLATLPEFTDVYGVKVYAYCLMTNHVHLLVVPEDIVGLGGSMKRLAERQTRYHNRLEGRTGTLWESRYKSSPVDSDNYLPTCTRYIELNPVRARMVSAPEAYAWSSCRSRLKRNPQGGGRRHASHVCFAWHTSTYRSTQE